MSKLSKKLTDKIEQMADTLVADIVDEKEKEEYRKKVITVLTRVNLDIELVLDNFEEMGAELLKDLYPRERLGVPGVIATQRSRLSEFSSVLTNFLSPIKDVAFKMIVAETVHALLDVIIENNILAETEELAESKNAN